LGREEGGSCAIGWPERGRFARCQTGRPAGATRLGTDDVDAGVVDFNLLTTVDRPALVRRATSLSEIARNALRSKLAEFTAW
jgi:hypothetical protein